MAFWYVDNSVGSSGAGTSWAAAWKDFNNITWGGAGVVAGDTLYISGGAYGSSQTYSAHPLSIGVSGSAGNLVTVSGAIDLAHGGTVIIDGTNNGIVQGSNFGNVDNALTNTYLVIQNLTINNTYEQCVAIRGLSSGTVLLQNLNINTGMGITAIATNNTTAAGNATLHFASLSAGVQAQIASCFVQDNNDNTRITASTSVSSTTSTTVVMGNAVPAGKTVGSGDTINFANNCRGIVVSFNTGGTVTIQNCVLNTPTVPTIAQTDTIYVQNNTGTCQVITQNCAMIVSNQDNTGHSDCYQAANGNVNLVVRNCYLSHPLGGMNNHGFILSDVGAGGTYTIYNNIVYMGSIIGTTIGIDEVAVLIQRGISGDSGAVLFYNNTIFTGYYGIDIANTTGTMPAHQFKNNIIYMKPNSIAPYILETGDLPTKSNLDYNLVVDQLTNTRLFNPTGASTGAALSTTSLSSGLKYFEIQIGLANSSGNTLIGIGNASATLTNFTGSTTNSLGWQFTNGNIYCNGSNTPSTVVVAAAADCVAFAVDFTHSKMWIKDINTSGAVGSAGGWNGDVIGNQNPATNTGGISFTQTSGTLAAGPYFIMASAGNNVGESVILNANGPFVQSLPSGFSAWGTTTTWDPAHVGSPATLVLPIAIDVSTYETWAAWQTLGYDVHGVNADPQFVGGSTGPLLQSTVGNVALALTSPALNAGVTEATVTTDYYGQSRPQQTSYAIGAFEPVLLQSQACL